MTVQECTELILRKYPDSKVMGVYGLSDGYLVSIKPKTWSDDNVVLDGLFKITNNRKITEYSPVMNPEEFKKAIQKNLIG